MTERIERRFELPTSVGQAWRALTEPEWLALWLADEVELEPWAGGAARFRVGDSERTGWVDEVSPPPTPMMTTPVGWPSGGARTASRRLGCI